MLPDLVAAENSDGVTVVHAGGVDLPLSGLFRVSSSSDFRDAMARMPSSISIVTTDGPLGKWGVTASAVCSVSDSPPTVLVCLNRESRAHGIIKKNLLVGINVLNEDQAGLSRKFASKNP